VKPHGTHTAANSSYLTDGASAVLIMEENKAKSMGFTPKTVLKDFVFVSQDPREQLLLGPAYAIAKLLTRHNLKPSDVGVWELHEAFAGQVLANLKALDSDAFTRDNLKLSTKIGEVGCDSCGMVRFPLLLMTRAFVLHCCQLPMDKLNTLGGSLSIGHPFGATGGRLVTTASNRMVREGSKYGVLAACAAGGIGTAMLLELY
jgi:acetyl-CoA acyltransferase